MTLPNPSASRDGEAALHVSTDITRSKTDHDSTEWVPDAAEAPSTASADQGLVHHVQPPADAASRRPDVTVTPGGR